MCFYYDGFRRIVHLVVAGSEYVCEMTIEDYEQEFGFRAASELARSVWL